MASKKSEHPGNVPSPPRPSGADQERQGPGQPAGGPGPLPPGLNADKHARAQQAAARGEAIRDRLVSVYLADAVGGGQFSPADFEAYLAGLIHDAGVPADPVQRMLVEQLAFVHLRLVALHLEASRVKTPEGVKVYNGACARLMGEFRRTALALSEMRGKAPAAPRLKLAQAG